MVKKVYCPDCGKWLLSVVDGTTGGYILGADNVKGKKNSFIT